MSATIEALYQEVYARPDDDEIRRVLADALLAIDDPRGEFIQVQLHPERDYQLRAMRLIQRYGLTWLGKLRNQIIPLSYERGFLASCQAITNTNSVIGAEEWSTVHTIELDAHSTGAPAFLVHPVMRALRRITNATAEVLEWLPTQTLPPTLVELETHCAWRTFHPLFGALSHLPLQVIKVSYSFVLRRDANGQWIMPAELPSDRDPEDSMELVAYDDDGYTPDTATAADTPTE